MRRSRPKKIRVINHAKPNGTPTPAATAARRGGFSVGEWPAELMVQFSSEIPLKGRDGQVEEEEGEMVDSTSGKKNWEEVDVDIEGIDVDCRSEEAEPEKAEKADKTDDTW